MSSEEQAEAATEGAADEASSEVTEKAKDDALEGANGEERGEAEGDTTSDVAPAADPALESLRAERDALAAERDKLKEQLLRTAADFDNFRKRARREVEDGKLRGKDEAVKDFLPVVDNLERAVQAAESAQDVSSVVEGVRMVLKLFEDTATRMGLNRIAAVGERFDPAIHDAIQQQPTDAAPPGTIVAEITPGYQFGKRLLRAAMVIVARAPEKPKSEPPPDAAPTEEAPAVQSEAPAEGDDAAASAQPPESTTAAKSSKPPAKSSKPPAKSSRPPAKSSKPPAPEDEQGERTE